MLWLFGAAAVAGSMLQFHRLGPRLGMTTLVKPADALLAAGIGNIAFDCQRDRQLGGKRFRFGHHLAFHLGLGFG